MKDKLGKKLVLSTDIAAVARQIMEQERVHLVLRLSGMLLKGLVIVYSKKTQYMLIDCEDVINKIMQSFRPGAANLPVSSRRPADDAVTVPLDREGAPVITTVTDLDEWLRAQNPEAQFAVAAGPLEFPTPQNSQAFTQMSESSLSSQSNSQLPLSDELSETFVPPQPIPAWEPVPQVPDWNDVEPDDDGPLPAPPSGSESSEEEGGGKAKPRVVDPRIDLPAGRVRARKRARPAAAARAASLPRNEELEDLFEIARKQFAPPPPAAFPDSDGDVPLPGFDDLPEIERNRDARRLIDEQSSDDSVAGPRRGSLLGDDIEMEPRRSISGLTTPTFMRGPIALESPFPNYKFAVEATPRRSVENSVTTETIHTLNKISSAMSGRENIPFEQAFAGASRHGAAFAFYQLMVLRSTGAIGLAQNQPFDTIRISPGQQFGVTA
jgi:cohesin complex subunit SCC1